MSDGRSDFLIQNNGVTQLAIDESGNVGIGDASPDKNLVVKKDHDGTTAIQVVNSNDTASSRSVIQAGSDGLAMSIRTHRSNYTAQNGYALKGVLGTDSGLTGGMVIRTVSGDIEIGSTSNTSQLILKPDGKVGIGTTAPDMAFHVEGYARIGGYTQARAYLYLTAGSATSTPASTTIIQMVGYGGRGQGIKYQDLSYSGQEWFSGINYASAFKSFQIGYDASGLQGEYVANALFTVKDTGKIGIKDSNPYATLTLSGAGGNNVVDRTFGITNNSDAGIAFWNPLVAGSAKYRNITF